MQEHKRGVLNHCGCAAPLNAVLSCHAQVEMEVTYEQSLQGQLIGVCVSGWGWVGMGVFVLCV